MTSCPTPRKKAHPNHTQATAAMERRWRHPKPGPCPCRVYQCPCGAWHTTHRSLEGDQP